MRHAPVAIALVAVSVLVPARERPAAAQAPPIRGLDMLFAPAGAVRDTNDDGLADAIAARVIVPDDASAEDLEVAINLAARLGFETTAMTLPVAIRAGDLQTLEARRGVGLPILVGRSNPFLAPLIEAKALAVGGLEKGQGLIAFVAAPLGGPDGIAILGADEAGTLAAGNAAAAYLPRLWGASGARLDHVDRDVREFLQSRGVRTSQPAAVTTMVVDAERRGLKAITVQVGVAPGDFARARTALGSLDEAHRRGRDAAVLNFANVAETVVELVAAGVRPERTLVRRSGPNARAMTPPDDPPPASGRGGVAGGVAAGGAGGAATGGRGGGGDEGGGRGGGEGGAAGGAPGGAPVTFDLSSALSIDGWFADTYPDLMADRVNATILFGAPAESLGAAHIGARLGLDSTGISLPIARSARDVEDPSREASPILVGRDNRHVDALVKIGRARLDGLAPGEGVVQIIPRAFGGVTATVVAGADSAGTLAAATYLARRAPYVWETRRGSPALADVTRQAADAFNARLPIGQAALAVAAVDEFVRPLAARPATEKPVEGLEITAFVEARNAGLDTFLSERVRKVLPNVPVKVTTEARTAAVPVFEDRMAIPWEVTEFRDKLAKEVLPRVKGGADVFVEARLSEAPELRRELAEETRKALASAGAGRVDVRIRSAYKQGFLWMAEEVLPALKGRGVTAIHVKVREHKPDFAKKFRFYTLPSRWLHELYPIDEVAARDLGLPVSAFSMELVADQAETYLVEARDRAGRVVHRTTFSPKVVEREYLEKFPGWSRVEVTTGWLTASVAGQPVVDARIATDPERFWDYYQGTVLTRIYDHVMRLTSNRPTTDQQPFHRDLDVEVWLSEPDFRIGIDEEQVSAIEALHEDLYFVTLDFYRALGRATTRQALGAPGKILPILHPERRGRAGEARILYAANAAPRPRVEFVVREAGVERPARTVQDLQRVDVGTPELLRVAARADRLREIEITLTPPTDREGLRAVELLDTASALHAAGLYRDELSLRHVDRLAFVVSLRDARAVRTVAATGMAPASNVRLGEEPPPLPVVTWDHVISPDESESIVRALSAFPAVAAYRAGRSFRGRDTSVLEITLPHLSEQISITKYTAYKPTIVVTGRQHANEVSSTSHILKLAELLATDPAYAALLKRLNVVLHPVENPDGAAMAFELQKLTPTHMLHAGRYSALGQDVGGGSALLPEAEVRGRIWREWRPDIYLNPHGYPSHEWVQSFAGYVSPQFRAYWSSRGWYTQLGGLRDPRLPGIAEATDALRDAIARAITADAEIRALNLKHQDRYRRWANGFAPFIFSQEIYQDAAIYYTDAETGEPRGNRRAPGVRTGPASRATMGQWPEVTFNSGMTEAPDETAQGPWLNLVSRMGLSFLEAHLRYLHDGRAAIELIEEGAPRDGVARTRVRVRPVRPPR
jgi:hypothetical protein